MTYAVYVLVVEDTNESSEVIGRLGAANVDAVLDIETEEQAMAAAAAATEAARDAQP